MHIQCVSQFRFWMPERRKWRLCNFFHKIGCHGNVPWDIGKRGPDRSLASKTRSFGEKIAKIGPADPEIICLREIINKEEDKKGTEKEINASKIYSPVGNLAERAKLAYSSTSVSSSHEFCSHRRLESSRVVWTGHKNHDICCNCSNDKQRLPDELTIDAWRCCQRVIVCHWRSNEFVIRCSQSLLFYAFHCALLTFCRHDNSDNVCSHQSISLY